MPAFDYRQAEEIRDALARHQVRYTFFGKSGAILLGYSDTTQDADLESLPRLRAFREYWIHARKKIRASTRSGGRSFASRVNPQSLHLRRSLVPIQTAR